MSGSFFWVRPFNPHIPQTNTAVTTKEIAVSNRKRAHQGQCG